MDWEFIRDYVTLASGDTPSISSLLAAITSKRMQRDWKEERWIACHLVDLFHDIGTKYNVRTTAIRESHKRGWTEELWGHILIKDRGHNGKLHS